MLAPWDQCTGCMACSSICEGAIKVITDDEGFVRPMIVKEKCKACGRCTAICPVLNPVLPERMDEPQVFACAHVDEKVRLQSASGGVFSALARLILQRDGVVFGAAITEELRVEHKAVERKDQLRVLQKSKYVQSDVGRCLVETKRHLQDGRFVLFSGLPCQIAGLYAYLGKDYENLFTVDILCKGAPSPGVFETFIRSVESRYGSTVQSYSFREKIQGWGKAISVFKFADGRLLKLPLSQTSFGSGFSTELFLRPSCYHCIYRSIKRIGDISIGDFWGLGSDSSLSSDRQKGISLVLLNSQKGKSFFESISRHLLLEKRPLAEAVKYSSALKKRPRINCWRGPFFVIYKRYPRLALALGTVMHRAAVWCRDRIIKRPLR